MSKRLSIQVIRNHLPSGQVEYGYLAQDEYEQTFWTIGSDRDEFYAQFPSEDALIEHVLSTDEFIDFADDAAGAVLQGSIVVTDYDPVDEPLAGAGAERAGRNVTPAGDGPALVEEAQCFTLAVKGGESVDLVLLKEIGTGHYFAVYQSFVEQEVDGLTSPYGNGALSWSTDAA